jgi:hypothetical protein
MFNHELVAKSTAWEIQSQLLILEKDIEKTELSLKRLKFARKDLKISLCLKLNDQHIFKNGKCGCGAMDPDKKITSFKGA